MSEKKYDDVIFRNVANATSPKRSTHHMSELVYDVDYTIQGDAPMDSHEDMPLADKLERAKAGMINHMTD